MQCWLEIIFYTGPFCYQSNYTLNGQNILKVLFKYIYSMYTSLISHIVLALTYIGERF